MLLGALSLTVALAATVELLAPVVWVTFGEDIGLRLSLALLLTYACTAAVGTQVPGSVLVLSQIPITIVFFSLSWSLPSFIILFYGRVALQIVAPAEAILVVNLTHYLSRWLVERIDENPGVIKGFILIASATFYMASGMMYYYVFSHGEASALLLWISVISVVMCIMLTLLSVMNTGIILDPAVTSCYMAFVCVLLIHDTYTPPLPVTFTSSPPIWGGLQLGSLISAQFKSAAGVLIGLLSVKTMTRLAIRMYALGPLLVTDQENKSGKANEKGPTSSQVITAVFAACLPSLMYTELVSSTLLWTWWRAIQLSAAAGAYVHILWRESDDN